MVVADRMTHASLAAARSHRGLLPRRSARSRGLAPSPARRVRAPRLRVGHAAAARVSRVAADRQRPRSRPAHLQAGRPAFRPHAGRARRHHAAGGAHRRPPAQPQGRDAAVLLRQRAAHPAGRACWPRASRCRSAPSSTATPASRRTSRSIRLLARALELCGDRRQSRIDLGHVGIFRALAAEAGLRRRCRTGTVRRPAGQGRADPARTGRRPCRSRSRSALLALPELYGGGEVLDAAPRRSAGDCRRSAPRWPTLRRLARRRSADLPLELRSGRPARLPLSQRRRVRRLLRRQSRRGGARRSLRRGRRGLRPRPAGDRLLHGPARAGAPGAATEAPAARSWRPGPRTMRCRRRSSACAAVGRDASSLALPGHDGNWREAGCDRQSGSGRGD